ncbi:MAG: fumarate/nitrate reduction transcriptional regulator Fnr [Alteromonadaceae bacterium]|nr:fumarate/nitrate reduction transcriptional regulator Fnr [Alteromonadaceae bacterium]
MVAQAHYPLNCQNCSFSQLCLPFNLNGKELDKLDQIIKRKQPYQKAQRLFQAGDKLQSLYAVRSGSFKSYSINSDGEEQITAFHLPGEIIGFDALGEKVHPTVAQAMETSMVCEIPYSTLDDLSDSVPALRHQILRLMSAEIKEDQQMFMLLNQRTAEERIAYFIHSLSLRFSSRGFSKLEFRLTMPRSDIGNYLGLTVETVSRLFSKFSKEGLIEAEGKSIKILDGAAIEAKSKTFSPACAAS